MLGLARHLPARFESIFVTFAEGGRCAALVDQVRRHGFEAHVLQENAPRYRRAAHEIARLVQKVEADLVCCSGYKPDLLGWWAARRVGIPVVSISHGWTGATWKVRLNERCDRLVLRWMDAVVCVSEAQAGKVRAAGVAEEKTVVIHNAVGEEAFAAPEKRYGLLLRSMFPEAPDRIVVAAGRLSPEKGFGDLVEAAATAIRREPRLGFVLFGDGPLRRDLSARIDQLGLTNRVVLAGFREDVTKYLPHADVVALPSLTEGLPVILLEALAAGVPVVATTVGGIPEVVEEGVSGMLVPAGEPERLAQRLVALCANDIDRRALGAAGRARVRAEFTFATQSRKYEDLFERLLTLPRTTPRSGKNRETAERALFTLDCGTK